MGGTLLASTLAVMPQPARVASLTLLATMLDFSDVGEIGVYIDEEYVARCEQQYRDGGLVPGRQLAHAFATLRANELIWHFHVNNYLKGTTPRRLRPAVLEQRQLQPARPPLRLVPAQHVPGEQPAHPRPGRAYWAAR